MDIFMLAAIAISGSLILFCMGLSFLSQSLNALDYSNLPYAVDNYNQNPLIRLGSKYYHWRPKNSVVVTEKKWAAIERGIARKIANAEEAAETKGYNKAMSDIKEQLDEGSTSFSKNPYKILDVAADADKATVSKALTLKLDLYALKNFSELDDAFRELAQIRLDQIREAYQKIGEGYKHIETK